MAIFALLPATALAQSAEGRVSYEVQAGDTLIGLGNRYFVSDAAAFEVGRINHIRNPRRIPIGTNLAIPQRLLRSAPVELKVQVFSGPVSIAKGTERLTPRAGLVLVEGSEIETGSGGFVTVGGSDGSRFTLPSHSRVRIVRSRRYILGAASDIDLVVRKGRADLRAASQKPGSEFRVRTPIAVSAVRGTAYRIGLAEDGKVSFTEVLEGGVAVETMAAATAVEAGFGAASRSDGAIAKEALLSAPALLAPGKVQTEVLVGFAAQPINGASGYRFQLARDAGFVDVMTEQVSVESRAEFTGIGNGEMFVRTSAIAKSGLEGLAETSSFRRQRLGLQASAGETGVPGGLRFDWLAEGEGSAVYRFQLLGTDTDSPPLIDQAGMAEPGLTLTGLHPGAYRWRVGVIKTTPQGSAEVWTPLQDVKINN
jgi:hypothetical protein